MILTPATSRKAPPTVAECRRVISQMPGVAGLDPKVLDQMATGAAIYVVKKWAWLRKP